MVVLLWLVASWVVHIRGLCGGADGVAFGLWDCCIQRPACVEGWVASCGVVVVRDVLPCVVLCPLGRFVRCVAGARRKHGFVSCCFV